MNLEPSVFLNKSETAHWELFEGKQWVWEALPQIRPYLSTVLQPEVRGQRRGSCWIEEAQVFIDEGTVIWHGAVIQGPAWIGKNCEIRPGAYIRENVVVGDGCILGNSCEFKNSILFNGCQVPHFSYVGDSILGASAHLGAGVICSNLKLYGDEIILHNGGERVPTGLRKLGAILGDGAEVGCNAVLNPGSLLGKKALVYSGIQWRGILAEGYVAKSSNEVISRKGLGLTSGSSS